MQFWSLQGEKKSLWGIKGAGRHLELWNAASGMADRPRVAGEVNNHRRLVWQRPLMHIPPF